MNFRLYKKYKTIFIGSLFVLFLAVLSYRIGNPTKFALGLIGLIGIIYYGRKLRNEFGVPLFFKRDGKKNKWGGRLGGLTGGLGGIYGATRTFGAESIQTTKIIEFSLDLTIIIIFLALGIILTTGTILQDVKDGYIEIP